MKQPIDDSHFPHHRLDAYRVAVDVAVAARRLAGAIPRGHRPIADQLQRAGSSAVLLIAEGANRRSRADKRQRFVLARRARRGPGLRSASWPPRRSWPRRSASSTRPRRSR